MSKKNDKVFGFVVFLLFLIKKNNLREENAAKKKTNYIFHKP